LPVPGLGHGGLDDGSRLADAGPDARRSSLGPATGQNGACSSEEIRGPPGDWAGCAGAEDGRSGLGVRVRDKRQTTPDTDDTAKVVTGPAGRGLRARPWRQSAARRVFFDWVAGCSPKDRAALVARSTRTTTRQSSSTSAVLACGRVNRTPSGRPSPRTIVEAGRRRGAGTPPEPGRRAGGRGSGLLGWRGQEERRIVVRAAGGAKLLHGTGARSGCRALIAAG